MVGSNVAAEIEARLLSAREHYSRGVEAYRAAADEMLEAKALDPSLSNRAIGKAMGIHHTTVGRLLDWRQSGADRTTSPFGGRHKLEGESDAAGDLPDPLAEPEPGPAVLQARDTVRMGEHVLIVGDSERPGSKLRALVATGLPFAKEFYDANAAEDGEGDGEMDVVVITDQPYGQNKPGITNDHRANWGTVYSLFKPRGGFVFCAYHPPLFREAEDGIIEAGGKPVEYLALDKGGGRMWGGGRVQNRLDAIIYFERAGAPPWQPGRHAVSLLSAARDKEAREERRLIGGDHGTPKYIDVLIKLIGFVTAPGSIVLDPFAGSGTTLIACQRTGRRFIGVEFEPKWADLVVVNWQRETGRDAIVSREFGADNVKFNDLKADPALGDGPDVPA